MLVHCRLRFVFWCSIHVCIPSEPRQASQHFFPDPRHSNLFANPCRKFDAALCMSHANQEIHTAIGSIIIQQQGNDVQWSVQDASAYIPEWWRRTNQTTHKLFPMLDPTDSMAHCPSHSWTGIFRVSCVQSKFRVITNTICSGIWICSSR